MPSTLRLPARSLAAVLLLLFVSGCNAVYVRQPVGEKPHVLQEEKWNGSWLNSDNAHLTALVTNAERGELKIGAIEAKNGELTLSTETIVVRSTGNSLFLNHAGTHDGRTQYTWALVKIEDDLVTFWTPDVDKFRALVRSGKLKGEAPDSGSVYLDEIPAEMLTAIAQGTAEGLFEWRNPFTLRRVKR